MINPNFGSVIGDSYAYIAVPANANQYVAASIDGKIYGISLASPDGHAMIGVPKPGTYTLHNVRKLGMLGDALYTVTITERHKIYAASYSTPETRAKAFSDITEDEFLAISKDIAVGNITSDDLPWKVGDKNTKFTRKAYTNGTYTSNYNESGDTVPFHLTIADINQNKYKTTRKSAYLFIIPKLFSGFIRKDAGAFGNWTSNIHKLQSSTNSVYSSTVLYANAELIYSYFSDKLSRALKPLTVDSNCIELSNRDTSGRYQSYIEFTDTCTQPIQLFASSDFVDNDLSHRFSIFKDAQDSKDLCDKIINLFELSYPGSNSYISVLLRDASPIFLSSTGNRIYQNVYEMMGKSKSDVTGYITSAYNASSSYSWIPGFCAI